MSRRTLPESQARGTMSGGMRVFQLRDYLGPRPRYAYDELPGDLDACYRAGEAVAVLDVPGLSFTITGSSSLRGAARPWEASGTFYETAWDAVLGRGGMRSPGSARRRSRR